MILGSSRKLKWLDDYDLPQITVDGNVIPYVNSTKHLGVHITNNLSWDVHVAHTTRKVYGTLNSLKSRKNILSTANLYEHSFLISSIRLWREIPPDVINSFSIEAFKSKAFEFFYELELREA
ncbi:Protein of unknown function [Cotesia congregata]|uniref:Uncharacterized protein n=1 Tax=Cotesia congregata TaxID=51543 RepID=A0A8J2H0P2_COTCN|nr:Protein of unknown function [Cotesia congregata]